MQAKLFYEEHELKMVATKPIACGEQIASFVDVVLGFRFILTPTL